MTETITLELPVYPDDDRISVDALFTAIDHGSAYHGHEGRYSELYSDLETYLFDQVREQLNEDSE